LSIEPAVKKILDQWLSLKTHFEISRLKDNCYTAELLYSMHCDKTNLVYLSFLHPILYLVQTINKNFESKTADPTKLLSDLKKLYSTIANKIILPTARIDIYEDDIEKYLDPSPILGFAFESACTENEISAQDKANLKSQRMNALSVSECLKPNKTSITDLVLNHITKEDRSIITLIEFEWDNSFY